MTLLNNSGQATDLQTLLDKEMIRDLVLSYSRAVDRQDFAFLRSLYTEDAIEDDHGGAVTQINLAEDVANVVVKIVKEELWGKQLMLNAETWTYQKFIYTICEMLNRKPPQYRSNGILSNLAVLKDTLLSRLQKKQNIITGETAFMSAQSFSYGCGWSNQLANLKYQPVEAILKKMLNEYINK